MRIDGGFFINDFINKNLRQYTIPVYQRNYEWSSEQCEKLFGDIIQAYKQDRHHFTGSVVYEKFREENKIETYLIIDGQQRLTTIYILLKALADNGKNEGEKEAISSVLFNNDVFKRYQIDESSKLKLKPIKSDNQQLLLLMSGKISEMDKSSGIYKNYALFCKLIQKAFESDPDLNAERIYYGIGKLTCAMIKLEDEEKGKEQEIFERINSTGVPLSLADKIRNYVLMTDVDQERLYEEYWLKTEQLLTKDQIAGFFLDFLNLKLDGFTKENEAYDNFKLLFEQNKYTNESMLAEIYHRAKQYHVFLNGDTNLGEGAHNALIGLRKLNQSTVYLFLFNVFDDYEKGVIDNDELTKVLNFLLRYSIRRLICEIGSNSLRGLYKTLYTRVFARPENKEHYYDAIVSFLTQLTSKDAIPTDEEFTLALKEKNLYRKNALCKYLLVAIENQGKGKVEIDQLSIEHILPQNKNLPKAWRDMLGEDWEYIQSKYLHTLGNLTLTAYNSEYSDRPFDEKKYMLENPEKPNHIKVLYNDVVDQAVWNEETIQRRAGNLCKIILKLFAIEKPEYAVDFSDPRYREYTAANPGEATYKTVNYYELLGERVNIDSFAGMVKSLALKLYEYDNTVIEGMAQRSDCFEGWMYPFCSYDLSKVKNGQELKAGTGIYLSTGFSAHDCVSIIRNLLRRYDLDVNEDFVYSARPNNVPEDKISRLEIAKGWCEQRCSNGEIGFKRENSQQRYVRFTTKYLDSIIPESPSVLSPWKTPNFYFYEITNFKNEFFIQLYFYCKNLSDEMRTAYTHLADILDMGELKKGYMLFFKSKAFPNEESDNEQTVLSQLDALFEEVKAFEEDVKSKWEGWKNG